MLDDKDEGSVPKRAFHFSAPTTDGIQPLTKTGDLSDLGAREREDSKYQKGLLFPM
jgi:hypothetical protein